MLVAFLVGALYIGIIVTAIWEPTKDLAPINIDKNEECENGEVSVDLCDAGISS